jgi:hypothetical protein
MDLILLILCLFKLCGIVPSNIKILINSSKCIYAKAMLNNFGNLSFEEKYSIKNFIQVIYVV